MFYEKSYTDEENEVKAPHPAFARGELGALVALNYFYVSACRNKYKDRMNMEERELLILYEHKSLPFFERAGV